MNCLDSMKRVMDSTNRNYIAGNHELGDIYQEILAFANEMGKMNEIKGYFFGTEYMQDSNKNYSNLQSTDYYDKQIEEALQFQNNYVQGRVM